MPQFDTTEAWDRELSQEWLVADGLGGYASGTVLGPHTRRYHGLLVAPLAPPLGRHVLLSKLEETIEHGGGRYDLSANEYQGGTVTPLGFQHLERFSAAGGVPTWVYRAGNARLVKRVSMEQGQTTTYVSYTLEAEPGAGPASLTLTPLCVFRDFHRETVGSEDWRFRTEPLPAPRDGDSGITGVSGVTVRAYGSAPPYHLLFRAPRGQRLPLEGSAGWWWHFLHRAERERGLDYLEDAFAIGTLRCELRPGETLLVAATIENPEVVARRLGPGVPDGATPEPATGGGDDAPDEAEVRATLQQAAHQFLVARDVPGEARALGAKGTPAARTVLAGYHWFGDWGRDTMIALPGLALATGRVAEARAILRAFAAYVDQGMLPNRFPDSGAPLGDGDYNTVDATLWYFHAIHAVEQLDPAGAGPLVAELLPALADIVEWHVRGTRFGIRMDPLDGLIRVENPQLTWMDAKVGDWVCTPRAGKPVEIAALWHHALGLLAGWASRLGQEAVHARCDELRRLAESGFRRRFWYAEGGYLYDLVDAPTGAAGGVANEVQDDASLRPNQAIALGLADCPLAPEQRRSAVDVIVGRLWTPRGLRTLAPEDERYQGHYGGDTWQRDGAYHQGTVWPWLLGSLVDAYLLAYGDRRAARRLVEPLRQHLWQEACAGSVSEIFDGDPPHAPRGCVAQAWSVAELYRAWVATAA